MTQYLSTSTAATKVKVIQDRAEAKDYLDVDRLVAAGIDLPTALAAARAVYGPTFNVVLSLKALSFFDDGDLAALPETVRGRLTAAIRATDFNHLPRMSPLPGDLRP